MLNVVTVFEYQKNISSTWCPTIHNVTATERTHLLVYIFIYFSFIFLRLQGIDKIINQALVLAFDDSCGVNFYLGLFQATKVTSQNMELVRIDQEHITI